MSMDFERLRARIGDLESQAHEALTAFGNIVEDGLELLESLTNATGQDEPVKDESPVEDGPVAGILPNVGEWFNDGGDYWARCSKVAEDKVYYDVCVSAYSYISAPTAPFFFKKEFEPGGGVEAIVEYDDLPSDVRATIEQVRDRV